MDILITEAITNATVTHVLKEILAKKDDKKVITLYINSPGGDVDAGYAIYDILRLSGRKIITYAVSEVFSCAIILYLAGDERYASNYSNFMVHEPYDEYDKDASITTKEYTKSLKELQVTTDDYFKLISKHTTLTPTKIKNYVKRAEDGEWYFKTAMAKKLGFVTKIGIPLR